MIVTKKQWKEAKKKELRYRLKNKNLKICWICWKWNDWLILKKSEAQLLKDNPQILETCENCKTWVASWVSMICMWIDCHTQEPCNSFYVLDLDMVKKYVPDAELWSSFEIFWCSRCTPDQKIHLTKESVNEAYIQFNNQNG